jgi:metal-responsive CopG/Arc/MetJ family transcriptional regulator
MSDEKAAKPVTILIDEELLKQVDERAKKLDLNRSQFFRRAARHDLESATKEQKEAA